MSGKIEVSSEVNKFILANKNKLRKGGLDSITAMMPRVKDHQDLVLGMQTIIQLTGVQLETDWTISNADKVRIYSGDEQTVLQKLHQLPMKKVLPIPEKVLVKMVQLRFYKIWAMHHEMTVNYQAISSRQLSQTEKDVVNLKFPDFKSVNEVQEFFMNNDVLFRGYWKMRERVDELKNLLKEKETELNDAIMEEAWKTIQVREVMET